MHGFGTYALALAGPEGGAGISPDTDPPVLQSAVTDGYTVTLTYDDSLATVPLPSAYTFGGDPSDLHPAWAYRSGSTVSIPLSKPVYQGQTLTISSTDGPEDASGNKAANLSAQAVTNNSTRTVATLVTSGLIHDVFADAGVTHTGDNTDATAVADQSGTGSNLVAADAGGPLYQATGWIDGTPTLNFTANDGLRTDHSSLVTTFAGSAEWTVCLLAWTVANAAAATWWSVSDKARPSGNHWIAQNNGLQQMRAVSNHAATGNITRAVTDYSQYTKAPFPVVIVWRKVGAVLQCFVNNKPLTYDDPSYAIGLTDHDTFMWGRGWSAGNETGSGLYRLKRGLVYNRALTDDEVAQNSRYLGILGSVPVGGAHLGEAVAA